MNNVEDFSNNEKRLRPARPLTEKDCLYSRSVDDASSEEANCLSQGSCCFCAATSKREKAKRVSYGDCISYLHDGRGHVTSQPRNAWRLGGHRTSMRRPRWRPRPSRWSGCGPPTADTLPRSNIATHPVRAAEPSTSLLGVLVRLSIARRWRREGLADDAYAQESRARSSRGDWFFTRVRGLTPGAPCGSVRAAVSPLAPKLTSRRWRGPAMWS